MTSPNTSDAHIDYALSNVSVAILQKPTAFIADKVFPKIPVQNLSNKYFTYPRGFFNRTEAEARGPATEAKSKDYTLSSDNYSCETYAIKKFIPDQIRDNTDAGIDLYRDATTLLTHDLLIQRDVKWASEYFAGGLWTHDWDGDISGSVGTNEVVQWDDFTNSTPVDNIQYAARTVQESTGLRPNTLVLGRVVYDKLRRHPDIIELLNGATAPGNPAIAGDPDLAKIFEVERILVGDSVQNTAKQGQTDSHSFIFGRKALLCYAAPSPGLLVPSAGYTFSWTRHVGLDIEIRQYREEKIRSDVVEAETAYDMKLVSADLGFFWDNIVSTSA